MLCRVCKRNEADFVLEQKVFGISAAGERFIEQNQLPTDMPSNHFCLTCAKSLGIVIQERVDEIQDDETP